jgi:hypothetical protein
MAPIRPSPVRIHRDNGSRPQQVSPDRRHLTSLHEPYDVSYDRLLQLIALCGDLNDAPDAVQEAFMKAIRRGRAFDGCSPVSCDTYRLEAGQAGGMFWFRRNTLSGSYLPFRARSRLYVAAGYAWPTRAAPSSIRKLTYTLV